MVSFMDDKINDIEQISIWEFGRTTIVAAMYTINNQLFNSIFYFLSDII